MLSRVRLFVIPWAVPPRLLCPWNSPGKNTGVGYHFLFQGIFPTQESDPHLLHWQVDSLLLSHLGSPYHEAWHAAVHGVAKSQTWLSNWTTAAALCGFGLASLCILIISQHALILCTPHTLSFCVHFTFCALSTVVVCKPGAHSSQLSVSFHPHPLLLHRQTCASPPLPWGSLPLPPGAVSLLDAIYRNTLPSFRSTHQFVVVFLLVTFFGW